MIITKLDWAEAGAVVQTIETKILGDDYLSSFIMLRKLLSNMQGIEDIQTREIEEARRIMASLQAEAME